MLWPGWPASASPAATTSGTCKRSIAPSSATSTGGRGAAHRRDRPAAAVLPARHITTYAGDAFVRLADEQHLRGLGREAFVDRLTYFAGEINALHPFRDGRTQRAFSASSLAMLTIAERWRVPLEVRARRRSREPATGQRGTPAPGTKAGKVPRQVHPGHERSDARGADERGDLSRRASSAAIPDPVKPTPVAAAR